LFKQRGFTGSGWAGHDDNLSSKAQEMSREFDALMQDRRDE
jgi:hypothetical protein